jgi:hypothetical protein
MALAGCNGMSVPSIRPGAARHGSARVGPTRSLTLAVLTLCVACGSAQTDPHPAADGSSGTSGSSGASGSNSGASGSAGNGQSGGGAGGEGTAHAGSSNGGASGGASGTSGSAGKGGGSAGGETGGAGGMTVIPSCPATPPGASSCASNAQECFYEDCAGVGRSVATCTNGTWSVQRAACGAVECSAYPASKSCASGQICSVSEGGALLASCIENHCGTGPVTCECAASCASCSILGSLEQGVTVICGACPSGTCA